MSSLVSFALAAWLAGASPASPAAECSLAVGSLRIDGSLADDSWRALPTLGRFRTASGEAPTAATEVRACYDDKHLYLIATCREPNVKVLRRRRPGESPREGDYVEFELTAPGRGSWRLALSPGGAAEESRGGEPRARAATRVFLHAWGAEAAVPWSVLGVRPRPGLRVNLAITRRRWKAKETSYWPGKGHFAALKLEGPPAWLRPVKPVRPRAGVRYSAADIERARANVKRFPWARALAARAARSADACLRKPASYWLSFLPPKGATFAYGFAGCPKCRAAWPRFGRGMCSFDRPGKVTCPRCKTVFPSDDPHSPYADPGDGVVVNGVRYYFKGVWNAWVINQYKAMLTNLAFAYALTGDERYAERAARLFDAMATLAPSTVGPRDNMRPWQKKAGIFHYYTQQLTEHLREYLLLYDLLYHSPAMDRVSPTNPTGFGTTAGYTVRQNIEKNLFLDTWDVEMNTRGGRLPSLHNHTSATVRAMLGVGLVCGKPDFIRWGIEDAYKFLANTIDPEGQYYESSGHGYNQCGRNCNASFADMLWNYDPRNYARPERFPQPRDYPYHVKLYRMPRLRRLLDDALYEMDCAGHIPSYGDSSADTAVVSGPVGQWAAYRFRWAFALYCHAESDADRRVYYRKMLAAAGGRLDRRLGRTWDAVFWFEPLKNPPPYDPRDTFNLRRSSLWGRRATAVLRQGEGDDRLALLLLGGTIFPHGHDDTLNLALYSRGQLLTHEIAYNLYGRPVHLGWAMRSIAHCTVTVDERGGPPMYRGGPNADVTGFVDLPSVSFVAMRAGPACWKSQPAIRRYERACALVKLPGEGGYFLDLFRVQGGKQHDYALHGQVTRKGEGFSVEGAALRARPGVWTLAGLSGSADASFDAPGRSWGERVLPGSRIRQLGLPGEKVGYFGWYPPPRNGYGFLYDVKAGPAGERVVADWLTHRGRGVRLRVTLFPGAGAEILTAKGPDLTGRSVIPFLIARRRGADLRSEFLAVMEGYAGRPRVRSVSRLPARDGMPGVEVRTDACVDRVWWDTDGRFAFIRCVNGEPRLLALYQARRVAWADAALELRETRLAGRVTRVDYAGRRIYTTLRPAQPAALIGRTLFVSSPDYRCDSGYRIASCGADGAFGFGSVGFDLAHADCARLDARGVAASSTPMPLAWTNGRPRASGLLDGKLALALDAHRSGQIAKFLSPTRYRLKPGFTLKQGDRIVIYDVKPGDVVTVPLAAVLRRGKSGDWSLFTAADAVVRLGARRLTYRAADLAEGRAELRAR